MNRITRSIVPVLAAAALFVAPVPAGASDSNVAYAANETDGTAVASTSVQFRMVANGIVDQKNAAYAVARCTDCQTFAAAFQLVVINGGYDTLVPHNKAYSSNILCEECLTWAAAKQVIVASEGPASLTGNGHRRMRALEDRLAAIEADLPHLSLAAVADRVDSAFEELLDIARTEVRRIDGGPQDSEVVATRSS